LCFGLIHLGLSGLRDPDPVGALAMEVLAVVALVCSGGLDLVGLGLGCLGMGGQKKRDFWAEHS